MYTKGKSYKGRIVSGTTYGLEGKDIAVYFEIKGDNSFTDNTTANYEKRGAGSTLGKLATQELAKRTKLAEMSWKYQDVAPKSLSFSIDWMASGRRSTTDRTKIEWILSPDTIRSYIAQLQSLCYPRLTIAGNPPRARLSIARLYNLIVYVTQVTVTWKNFWRRSEGMPMGASVEIGVMPFEYPTAERVRELGGFKSKSGEPWAGQAEG